LIKNRDRKNGRYLGGHPSVGYSIRSDGMLAEQGVRRQIIRKILRMKVNVLSLRQIASELSSSGVAISHGAVAGLLKSAGYVSPRNNRSMNLKQTKI
jgi:DNA invertase Pin-like site-specific DNA recombinase